MSEYKRVNRRYDLNTVDAVVAGTVCRVNNVSVNGILIEGWENPPPIGTTGAFTLRTPLLDKVQSMEIIGTVVRIQPDGEVALTFEQPRADWQKLLVFLDKKQREGEDGD